jgi:thiol-disulfide isomerase/thioredoxin
VVIDFWGVWCGPCKAAMPKLKQLLEQYKDKGLVVVGVHTTNQGDKMSHYTKEAGLTWPIAVDVNGQTVKSYAVDAYPAYYLIDRTGMLRITDVLGTDLENAIKILLEEKVAASK